MENTSLSKKDQVLWDVDSMVNNSKMKMRKKLKDGFFKEHIITNSAVSFSDKENSYLEGYLCFIKTKNYKYVLECK